MINKNDIIKVIPELKILMNKLNINADINEFKKYIKNMPQNEFNHIINIIAKNHLSKKVKNPRSRSNNLRRLSNRGGSKFKKSTKKKLSKRGGSSSSDEAITFVRGNPARTFVRGDSYTPVDSTGDFRIPWDERSPGEIRSLLFMTCLTLYIYYTHDLGWPLTIAGMATLATPRFVRDINQRVREHPFNQPPPFDDGYY
jgi:hypothetical protein